MLLGQLLEMKVFPLINRFMLLLFLIKLFAELSSFSICDPTPIVSSALQSCIGGLAWFDNILT
jgi:hypothetical protein